MSVYANVARCAVEIGNALLVVDALLIDAQLAWVAVSVGRTFNNRRTEVV